jgi:hypothetical protein
VNQISNETHVTVVNQGMDVNPAFECESVCRWNPDDDCKKGIWIIFLFFVTLFKHCTYKLLYTLRVHRHSRHSCNSIVRWDRVDGDVPYIVIKDKNILIYLYPIVRLFTDCTSLCDNPLMTIVRVCPRKLFKGLYTPLYAYDCLRWLEQLLITFIIYYNYL